MEKIRVCHICNLGMNGKAVFLCNLLENTNFEKYEVTIINYRAEHAIPVISRLEKLPIIIVDPPKGNEIVFCKFLNIYFESHLFNVCHSHIWDQSGMFLAIAHWRGIPVRVAHSHNTSKADGRYNTIKGFIRDKIIWRIMLRMIQSHANRYVGGSEEAARWLFVPSIIKKKQYVVIPNGIDLSKYRNPGRTAHTPTEILFAGRLIYQKNPLFAINAFYEYLLKKDPTAHMTMVGKGKMKEDVKTEIERLAIEDHITLVNETNEMDRYYKAADLFLFPSHYEGMPLTLVEAQASGLKCLSGNNVSRESQCGLVIYKELEDGPAMWGDYISELLRDNSLTINENALQKYDAKNTAMLMEEVYGL